MSKIMETQKKIEKGVVSGYKAIENGVVSGYKKIEDKFVETFFENDPRTTEKPDDVTESK